MVYSDTKALVNKQKFLLNVLRNYAVIELFRPYKLYVILHDDSPYSEGVKICSLLTLVEFI